MMEAFRRRFLGYLVLKCAPRRDDHAIALSTAKAVAAATLESSKR